MPVAWVGWRLTALFAFDGAVGGVVDWLWSAFYTAFTHE
jgi:hypothetical protein